MTVLRQTPNALQTPTTKGVWSWKFGIVVYTSLENERNDPRRPRAVIDVLRVHPDQQPFLRVHSRGGSNRDEHGRGNRLPGPMVERGGPGEVQDRRVNRMPNPPVRARGDEAVGRRVGRGMK